MKAGWCRNSERRVDGLQWVMTALDGDFGNYDGDARWPGELLDGCTALDDDEQRVDSSRASRAWAHEQVALTASSGDPVGLVTAKEGLAGFFCTFKASKGLKMGKVGLREEERGQPSLEGPSSLTSIPLSSLKRSHQHRLASLAICSCQGFLVKLPKGTKVAHHGGIRICALSIVATKFSGVNHLRFG